MDAADEVDDRHDVLVSAGSIDKTFVPTPKAGVARVELDGESVVGDPDGLQVHCLDAVSTIVWTCLDGEVSIDELSEELADAFGADRDTVLADLLAFARQLGDGGLLEGVAPREHEHNHSAWPVPESLPIGTDVQPFVLPTLAGPPTGLAAFAGRKLVLLNWSPACGFCRTITEDLADLLPALRDNGAELLLVAIGSAEANAALLEEYGLDCPLVLQDEDRLPEFVGLGTPVAYLLDEEGRIASELAVGAGMVPPLVRSAAGLASSEEQP